MFAHGPEESLGCPDAGASRGCESSNVDGIWEPTHVHCRSNTSFQSLSHLSGPSICPFETDLIHLIWRFLFTFTFLKMTSYPFLKIYFLLFLLCVCVYVWVCEHVCRCQERPEVCNLGVEHQTQVLCKSTMYS